MAGAVSPKFMNPGQQKAYFAYWKEARIALIEGGMLPTAADQERHVIHVKALGYSKSSKDLTNSELNKVIDAFRDLYEGADPKRRERAEAIRRTAVLSRINVYQGKLGLDPGLESSYVRGIARNVFREPEFEKLKIEQLTKLEGIIVAAVKRKQPADRMKDIHEQAAAAAKKFSEMTASLHDDDVPF